MNAVMDEKKIWTYAEYYSLDDDNRYEILEGELIMASAPGLSHQGISRDLGFILWTYVKNNKTGTVFFAPVDVVLNKYNVLQTDIVFVSKDNESILEERGIFGAPDLVVEILSPSTLRRDRHQKKAVYERFGVKEYWIVDRANRSIEVFILEQDAFTLHACATEHETVKSKVIDGFEVKVSEIM